MSIIEEKIQSFVSIIGEEKLKELREAAAPQGKKRLWIAKYCDDEQISELYYRLIELHDDINDVARIVRDIWRIQPEWDLRSFLAGLNTWKRRIQPDLDKNIDEQKKPKDKDKAISLKKKHRALSSKLDVLGRLGYAIEVQTERMMMGHDLELKTQTPLKMVDTIMVSLNDMIKNYVNLAIKTGSIDSAPSQLNINLQSKSEYVLSNYVRNDGNKMIRAADKLLTTLKDKCVKMEYDEGSGTYFPPEVLAKRKASKLIDIHREEELPDE